MYVYGNRWGVEAQIAREPGAIVAIGDGFAEQGPGQRGGGLPGVSAEVEVLANYQL